MSLESPTSHKEAYINQKRHFSRDLLRDSHYQGSGLLDGSNPLAEPPQRNASSIQLGGGYVPEWNKELGSASRWQTSYGAQFQQKGYDDKRGTGRKAVPAPYATDDQEKWHSHRDHMTTNNAFASEFAGDQIDPMV